MKQSGIIFILSGLMFTTHAFAKEVGEIKYARGAVTIQMQDGSGTRLIGTGDRVNEGEVIKTGPKSFAILNLADETKMTIRPKTSFAVEQMNAQKTSSASALLRLFRGGFRTITGYISKQNPRGYRVRTPAVTIGIRGTQFDARLCEDDCAKENEKYEKRKISKQNRVIGRVAYKKGDIQALNFADKTREIKTSSDLYEGDTLSTGSNAHAVIVFRDKSRISLQPSTQFRIDELRFDAEKPSGASALFSLLRGGLRAVTGLVGKLRPQGYRMRTRFSTIGIRGTGYDLLCTGPCGDNQSTNIPLPKGDGMYAYVWDGTILLDDRILDVGQAAFMKAANTTPVLLPKVPDFFKNNTVPRPDEIDVGEIEFAEVDTQDIKPGLYVSVTEGEVTATSDVTKELVAIKEGMAIYASVSGQQITVLPAVPAFQKFDIYPTPDKATTGSKIGSSLIGDEEGLVCEIQ